jgi:hypothetical protein
MELMAKFRKRPDSRIFEHVQFTESKTLGELKAAGVCLCEAGSFDAHVHTIHNNQIVELEDGDWIAPEPDGVHYYPIKDDIHEATYEAVGESDRES